MAEITLDEAKKKRLHLENSLMNGLRPITLRTRLRLKTMFTTKATTACLN